MKRIIIMPVLLLVIVILLPACSGSSSKQAGAKADSTKMTHASVTYTCTMHPEVTSDTPGECPKCGMTMVIKEINNKENMQIMQIDSAKK